VRKVSVGLEADIAGFVGPIGLASEKLEKLDDKVESLDRSLNKIPLDAMKAGAAMKLLSGDINDVGTNFQRVGDRSTAMTVLDARIKNTRAEVKKLGEEFVKTGDVDVFKRLNKSSGDLNLLTNLRKSLSNSVERGLKDGVKSAGPEAANTFTQLFQGGIIKAFSNPYVAAAAAALAVGLGAFIGAAIGGAIIAAGSLGVVGLGVAGAAMQAKQVGAAWSQVIDDIQAKWMGASKNFIEPLIAGAGIVRKVLGDLRLDAMFAKAATFIGPLSEAAAWFARNVINGVDALVQKGGPVIEVLRQELPEVGQAISDALTNIAGGNKGAADGLRDTLNLLEFVIREVGVVVRTTEDIYHAFVHARDAVGDFFHFLDENVSHVFALADAVSNFWPDADVEHHITKLHEAATATDAAGAATKGLGIVALAAGEDFKTLSSQIGQTAQTADVLAASMVNKIFTATMAVDQAAIGWNRSLLSVGETIEKNGRAVDKHTGQIAMNTKAGLDNRAAILSAVQANMQQYQSFIAAGGSAEDAAAAYDSNTAALEKQLRQLGYNQQQIDGLIGKYKGIPKNVNTMIAMQGLTDAINGLADLIRLTNHIPLSKVIVITTTYRTNGTPQQGHSRYQNELHGGILRAAEGLIVPPRDPGTVLFGEPATGGEAYIPLQGIPQSRAMSLAQTVGDNYGFQVSRSGGGWGSGPMSVTINFGGNVDGFMATAFMKAVRTDQIQISVR
jgi:hypothetical protein